MFAVVFVAAGLGKAATGAGILNLDLIAGVLASVGFAPALDAGFGGDAGLSAERDTSRGLDGVRAECGRWARAVQPTLPVDGSQPSGDLTGKTSGDPMSEAATTTLSSKGQVVIPEEIRARLGLKTGAQFVVVADRDVVIFKVLDPPSLSEFAPLVTHARRVAKAAGLRQADVGKALAKVRRSR